MISLMPSIRLQRQGISCLLLCLYLPACTSWHVGTPTPARFVETQKPDRVRVTRTDGSTLNLGSPTVRGDSVIGMVGGGLVREDTARTVGVALSDVRSVAVRKTSAGKTLLLVGGVALAAIVVGALIECSNRSGFEAIGCP